MMKKYAITDIGKVRTTNQDQAFVYTNNKDITIGIVCDGMGGHKAGAYASLLTSKVILDCFILEDDFRDLEFANEWLYQAIQQANQKVREKAKEDEKFKGMGTTLVVCLVLKDDILIANVGDSRAYILKNNEFMQVTEDQTYVNVLIKEGKIKPEEAISHPKKHVLMYAIGTMDNPKIDIYHYKKDEAFILMCSDGIYNLVNNNYLKTVLQSTLPISQKAISIIEDANKNGGYDNMSVVLMEVTNNG